MAVGEKLRIAGVVALYFAVSITLVFQAGERRAVQPHCAPGGWMAEEGGDRKERSGGAGSRLRSEVGTWRAIVVRA